MRCYLKMNNKSNSRRNKCQMMMSRISKDSRKIFHRPVRVSTNKLNNGRSYVRSGSAITIAQQRKLKRLANTMNNVLIDT